MSGNPNALYLTGKRRALRMVRPSLDFAAIQQRPGSSSPFDFSSNPFVNYPAPGAAASTVLTFTVPPGFILVVQWMAIVHWGGNIVDGSGNVIWRVLRNSTAIQGLNSLTSQFGTWSQPNEIRFFGVENDVFQVTVEVPAGQLPMPGGTTTSARCRGYFVPVTGKDQ